MAAVKSWITVNGQHIPIMEGQSKDEAVKNALGRQEQVKKENDEKQRQIDANKKQAEEKSKSEDPVKHMTADEFNREAKRQGSDLRSDDIEDYVTSSYGGVELGDKVSKFIDNCPENMKIQDVTTYRGMFFNSQREFDDFMNKHSEGKVLESRRDGLSWTTDRKVADAFSKEQSQYSVTLVNEDKYQNGISIKGFADTPQSSSEVLMSSSQDFDVVDVERNGSSATLYVTARPFLKKKYK